MRPTLLVATVVLGIAAASAHADDPPADAPAPSGPRLVVDRLEHDFGPAAQEQRLETTVTLRNEGTAPLHVHRTIPDCGCLTITAPPPIIPAGESATVPIEFRTMTFSGNVSKRVRFLTDDPERPETTIRLKVSVVAGVVLSPGRLFFGDVLLGSTPSKSLRAQWHEGIGSSFEVTAIEVPPVASAPSVAFDVKTASFHEPPWHGTEITFTFKTPPPLGMYSGTAIVRTNHPRHARLLVPLTANVSGRVWVQTRTVYFGWVPQGDSKSSAVSIRPLRPDGKLGVVEARAREGRVTTSLEPDPRGGAEAWRLVVRVPEDAAPGKIDDVIEVRTEVPGEPVTEIQVRGEVLRIGQ
jgi:hypothetical protein